jgi:hypothetical protein
VVFGKYGSSKKAIIHETNIRVFTDEKKKEFKRKDFDFSKDIETLEKKKEDWWLSYTSNPNFGKQCETLFSNIQEIYSYFFKDNLVMKFH